MKAITRRLVKRVETRQEKLIQARNAYKICHSILHFDAALMILNNNFRVFLPTELMSLRSA